MSQDGHIYQKIRLAIRNTIIFGHIKKGLELQGFSVVHHSSNCIQKGNNHRIHDLRSLERKEKELHKRYVIPVRVSVCPLYDAQRRSSSSNPSSSRSSSSFLHSTLLRKFFHSSDKEVNNRMSTSRDTRG
jgi:pyruvate/2-oxoacid:ferredoxin oxidoreductase beta subunit